MRRYIDALRNTEITRFICRHKHWIITILIPIVSKFWTGKKWRVAKIYDGIFS